MNLDEIVCYDSYLEYAFLKWVLSPAVKEHITNYLFPQYSLKINECNYRLDYAIIGKNINFAIELDGYAFHSSKTTFTYDRLRQNDIQNQGWKILRFSYDSIKYDIERCIKQLQEMLSFDNNLKDLLINNPNIVIPDMPENYLQSCIYYNKEGNMNKTIFDSFREKIDIKTLRKCQISAFSALSKYYDSKNKNAACVMSVGAGKTALGIASCLVFTQKRALIITPGSVIRGTFDKALNHENVGNVLYGLLGGPLIPGCKPPNVLTLDRDEKPIKSITRDNLLKADIIITNFHSLGTGEDPDDLLTKFSPEDIDMIVIDEAHIAASESYQRAFKFFSESKTLLMSACFQRLDGKKIDADVVYTYRLIDSIADGHAKNLRVERYHPDSEETTYEMVYPDGTREEIRGKEELLLIINDERKLARITAKSDTSIRKVMREVKKLLDIQSEILYPIKPRVLFSALGEKHAEQISRIAQDFGIPCSHLHYSMTDSKKKTILKDFEQESGNLSGIVQLKMLGQGYDFPPITVVVPLRPYGSFSEFYQFIGRGIRVINHPSLLGRVGPDKQFLDIVYHSELGLDEHIETIYKENDMEPSENNFKTNKTDKKNDIELPGVKGTDIATKPDTFVLFETGKMTERIVHDQERIEQRKKERQEEFFSQRYSQYVQSTNNPVSYENYKKILLSANEVI